MSVLVRLGGGMVTVTVVLTPLQIEPARIAPQRASPALPGAHNVEQNPPKQKPDAHSSLFAQVPPKATVPGIGAAPQR